MKLNTTALLLLAYLLIATGHGRLMASGIVPNDIPREVWEVHEWGTFTSFQASDGVERTHIAYEEHQLPAFSYDRLRMHSAAAACRAEVRSKVEPSCMQRLTRQKMETPVIYFYGGPDRVQVDVAFPRGVMTSWYPAAERWGPELGACYDKEGFAYGRMTWDVELLPADETERIIPVPLDYIWAPSREVPDARVVRTGNEYEKFLFYRGLGSFGLPVTVTSTSSTIDVSLPSAISEAFVVRWDGRSGAIAGTTGGPLAEPHWLDEQSYLAHAKGLIGAALLESGLTDDEVGAMLGTWEHSYFLTKGTRVLYLLPGAMVDDLLPLQITPPPDQLVRTMVARVDVMTFAEEQRGLGDVQLAVAAGLRLAVDANDRFFEARMRRLRELAETSEERAVIDEAIDRFGAVRDELDG